MALRSKDLSATSVLLNADMTVFMEEAVADVEIVDRKKNLVYLHIEEEVSEEASGGEAASEEASGEDAASGEASADAE